MRTRPWWIQSARLQSVWTWYMLCEHQQQRAAVGAGSARARPMHFFWNDSSPTASTSSVISTSGDSAVATAKPSRTTMPEE